MQGNSQQASRAPAAEADPPREGGCRPGPTRALIFDLDGTLYQQGCLRRALFLRWLAATLRHPQRGMRVLRAVRAYRRAQEILRHRQACSGDPGEAQLRLASERAGIPLEEMRDHVQRWMEEEPLPLLARCQRRGLVELLTRARNLGLRLGILSDYDALAKLRAMGVEKYFDVVVTARDPEVQSLKPNPRGLEVALHRLKVEKDQAIFIGDRADVDGMAALRAGVRCFILGKARAWDGGHGQKRIGSLSQLHRVLDEKAEL